MAKRYFEFSEGKSNKFWEVELEESRVITRYGKIGAAGQTTVKDEGTAEGAQKLQDKLVREKTGKGYVEKLPGGDAPSAPAPRYVSDIGFTFRTVKCWPLKVEIEGVLEAGVWRNGQLGMLVADGKDYLVCASRTTDEKTDKDYEAGDEIEVGSRLAIYLIVQQPTTANAILRPLTADEETSLLQRRQTLPEPVKPKTVDDIELAILSQEFVEDQCGMKLPEKVIEWLAGNEAQGKEGARYQHKAVYFGLLREGKWMPSIAFDSIASFDDAPKTLVPFATLHQDVHEDLSGGEDELSEALEDIGLLLVDTVKDNPVYRYSGEGGMQKVERSFDDFVKALQR